MYNIVFVANYVVQLKEGPTTTIELLPFWRHVKFHVPWEGLPRLIELSEIQEDSKTKVWETRVRLDEQSASLADTRKWHTDIAENQVGSKAFQNHAFTFHDEVTYRTIKQNC